MEKEVRKETRNQDKSGIEDGQEDESVVLTSGENGEDNEFS